MRTLALGLSILALGCEGYGTWNEASRTPAPTTPPPSKKDLPDYSTGRREDVPDVRFEPPPRCSEEQIQKFRTRIEVLRAQLPELKERREAYVKEHCTQTTTTIAHIAPNGSERRTSGETIWVCDGRPVHFPVLAKEQEIKGSLSILYHELQLCRRKD